MDKFRRYSYDAIQPDELRLCRFVEDNDHVCVDLKILPASASDSRYTALSYTWGSQDHDHEADIPWKLKIGEDYLPALDSIQSLVQALRSKGILLDGTWWWIDSICINQANIQERGEQVQQMKDIYRRAHNSLVWLGEQSDDSDRALDFICSLNTLSRAGHSDEEMRAILQRNDHQLDWIALRNFFLRSWWTRIWTVQEFVIPPRMAFLCGTRTVSRSAVCAALWVADRCNTIGFKDSIAFLPAWNRRRAWLLQKIIFKPEEGLGATLLALAAYFCSNEAKDDRDRLYGLTALSTEHHGLEVNYAWQTDEVYLRFAKSFIGHHKNLDILSFASLFSTTPASSLPSWVPDWRARVQPLVVPVMVSQSSCSTVGNLRPPRTFEDAERSNRYSACGSKAAVFDFEGFVLVVRGLVVDEIDSIAGSGVAQGIRSTERLAQSHDGTRSPKETLESICRSLTLGRGDRYLRFPVPVQFYNDFLHLCLLVMKESSHFIKEEFQVWFRSMASLSFNGMSFEDVLKIAQEDEKTAALIRLPAYHDEYIQDSFYGRFFDTVVKMSLCMMSSVKGHIGTVPEKAKAGDRICILYGCSVPMLLRKCEGEERFAIVGECYVDGFMNGEALKEADAAEVMFRIS